MNEKEFVEKNIRLSFELSKFFIEHPELEEKIPEGAEVVILLKNEPEFNKKAKKLAREAEREGQEVVFIRVKELSSMPASRLISPELVSV